jgi:hypothetical protein
MDPVTGAVIIAGLTTAGKQTADGLMNIIGKILNPSAESIGEGMASSLQEWAKRRKERAAGILIGAATILEVAQIEPISVPGRILMPILEKGSVEEDPELRQVWSRLLASAAMPDSSSRILAAYPHILAELTPLEVKVLKFVVEECQELVESEHSRPFNAQMFRQDVVSQEFKIETHLAMAIRDNLVRLYLIQAVLLSRDNPKHTSRPYSVTTLGCEFYQSCTGNDGYPPSI